MRTRPTATQLQPFHNHFPNHPTTAFQPRTNHREPQPAHNRPSTATQPRANHDHAAIVSKSHSSRPKPPDGRSRAWQTPTTQPSFVSNPRTIPTQPSSIRDSPTPTASSTTTQRWLKFWYNISAFSEEDVGLKNRAGGPSEMMLI